MPPTTAARPGKGPFMAWEYSWRGAWSEIGKRCTSEFADRGGGAKCEWAMAEARQRGKFTAAAIPAAVREGRKDLCELWPLGGDMLMIGAGAEGGY